MNLSSHSLLRLVGTLALVAAIGVSVSPAALADDWGRDRAGAIAYQELDPAIRTAIGAETPASPTVSPTRSASASPSDGFAWGAAALGLLIGVGAMCAALACVTLVRNDGRLSNA